MHIRRSFTTILVTSLIGLVGWILPMMAVAQTAAIPLERAVVSQIEAGKPGGRLVIGYLADPKTFNPLLMGETTSQVIVNRLFSPLIALNCQTMAAEPALVKAWEIGSDQRTWTFHLRQGLLWSDGTKLTADDVIFTARVALDPSISSPLRDALQIEGKSFEFQKIDPLTFKIVTPKPFGPMIENLAGNFIPIPEHAWKKIYESGKFNESMGINVEPKNLVVSGPFRLEKYSPGQTSLRRNPAYWKFDKNNVRLPYLDQIVSLVSGDWNTWRLKFDSGEIDYYQIRPEEVDDMKAAAAKGKYRVYQTGSYLGVNYFCFNLRPGNNPEGKPYLKPAKLSWFQNLTFRQAIIQAIDRANMVDTVYSGYGEVIHGPISPANKRWFNENIFKYEYSREKSAALLDSLDMKDRNGDGIREDKAGNPVEFVLVTNAGSPTRSALGNIIASDLKEVGIKVTLQTLDFNVLIPKLTSSFDYEAVLLAFAQGGNPVEQANVIPSSGMMHTFNSSQSKPGTEWEATADTLFNKFLVSFSYPEQKKYWDEIQNIYAKNLGWFYLANENISVAVRDNFKNLKPASYAQFHNILWNAEEISRK